MHVDAPYERMPLFVRAGSIVPNGKVIQSTKEEQKDLIVSVYAGADGSFTLYEDNGVTYDYEKGNYATIRLFMMMRGERSRSAHGRATIRA